MFGALRADDDEMKLSYLHFAYGVHGNSASVWFISVACTHQSSMFVAQITLD